MTKKWIAISALCSTVVMAQEDAKKVEFYGFVKMDYSIANQAVSSFGASSISNNVTSWNRIHANAVTEASADNGTHPNAFRSNFSLQQTRMGIRYQFTPKSKLIAEFDFVDFDRDEPINIRPRARVLGVNTQISEHNQLWVGQDWDITAPLKSNSFNFIGNYFRSGNIGFMRPQVRLSHFKGTSEKCAFMVGANGISDSVNDSAIERSLVPVLGARYFFVNQKKVVAQVSGIYSSRRFEQGTSRHARNAYAGVTNLQYVPSSKVLFSGKFYMGQNIQTTSSALTLSNGSFAGDQKEIGGVINAQLQQTAKAQWRVGAGMAGLLPDATLSDATILKNATVKLAFAYEIAPSVQLYTEASEYFTKYHWSATSEYWRKASILTTGVIATW